MDLMLSHHLKQELSYKKYHEPAYEKISNVASTVWSSPKNKEIIL